MPMPEPQAQKRCRVLVMKCDHAMLCLGARVHGCA